MTKIAILYASVHHKNTEKLIHGISNAVAIDLFDMSQVTEKDFSCYQAVGFASGIYMGKFHKFLFSFLNGQPKLPKKAFVLYTSGSGSRKYDKSFNKLLAQRGLLSLGTYQCKGYDTYGFWKFIGGIGKGHPNEADINAGVYFIQNIVFPRL